MCLRNYKMKLNYKLFKIFFKLKRKYYQWFRSGSKYTCPFCFHSYNAFIPRGSKTGVLKEKKVIGAGYRLNVFCPTCLSIDRERLFYIFMKENHLIKSPSKLLHIAPEHKLQEFFFKKENIDYITIDLHNFSPQLKMDITKIGFRNNCFDGIICSNVLEHIYDDIGAMKELFRVIKPNAWAIIQVPYSPIIELSVEDPEIVRDYEREVMFGQSDHVRLYGLDFFTRLKSVGFLVEHKKLSNELISKFALSKEEVIFCTKPKIFDKP